MKYNVKDMGKSFGTRPNETEPCKNSSTVGAEERHEFARVNGQSFPEWPI